MIIVSIAIAVLPVCLSPRISSLWPLPIGIIESIAFIPVCKGSFTDFLATTPGALISTVLNSSVTTSPLPSIGFPKPSTTRPSIESDTPTRAISPVLFTLSPSITNSSAPKIATPTLSSSRLRIKPKTPLSNVTNSPAIASSKP